MKKIITLAFSSLALISSHTIYADAAAGKQMFLDKCDKCHEEGGSIDVPDDEIEALLGLEMSDLKQRFEDVASGKTKTPKKMKKRMKKLSEADKANILDYLASGKK